MFINVRLCPFAHHLK